MSIEIIGTAGTKEVSETRGSFDGPPIGAGYLTRFAQAHEAAGFDTVLIRGFDPLDDVVERGAERVPLLREQAASTPTGTEVARSA